MFLYYVFVMFCIATGFILVGSLSLLLHELGHAIPAAFFTGSDVKVYVGSYGEVEDELNFKIGRFHFFLLYNPLKWVRGGLCMHSTAKSSFFNMLIVAGGPLTSVIIVGICYYVLQQHNISDYALYIVFMLLLVHLPLIGGFLLGKGIFHAGGRTLYSDRELLARYFKEWLKGKSEDAAKGQPVMDLVKMKSELEEKVKQGAATDKEIGDLIAIYAHARNYQRVTELAELIRNMDAMERRYRIVIAYAYMVQDKKDKAIYHYTALIDTGAVDWAVFNNRGYILLNSNCYRESLADFDRALELNPGAAYAYCNRGLAKVMLGMHTEGMEDINYSLKLDKNNAYGYRNLGIYYLETGNYVFALSNFEKAYAIRKDVPMLETLLHGARAKVLGSSEK